MPEKEVRAASLSTCPEDGTVLPLGVDDALGAAMSSSCDGLRQQTHILNLRASKEFVFAHGATVGVDMDVFNVVNTNAVTAAQFSSGPTFGYAQDVIPARIARIGVRFEF